MGTDFVVEARNNLSVPITLVITEQGNFITIAICESKLAKDDYDSVRISKNLEPNMKSWKSVGVLSIQSKHYLKVQGRVEK